MRYTVSGSRRCSRSPRPPSLRSRSPPFSARRLSVSHLPLPNGCSIGTHDGSFIRDLSEQPDSVAIVRAVVGLGSSLGISTTAEGVETEEQLQRLRDEGCTEVQGYLFSKPIPADEVWLLLKRLAPTTKAVA